MYRDTKSRNNSTQEVSYKITIVVASLVHTYRSTGVLVVFSLSFSTFLNGSSSVAEVEIVTKTKTFKATDRFKTRGMKVLLRTDSTYSTLSCNFGAGVQPHSVNTSNVIRNAF